MSTKGVYSALSGAMAQSQRLDTIANNLANVNTTGFKRDQQLFREYLTANEKLPETLQAPRIPASIESFYDMQGGDKSYVDSNGTYTDFTQGPLKHTGNKLDLAIDGAGFFEVATPQGIQLTRNGAFSIDGGGKIVTKDGFPLLAAASEGVPPEERLIRVQSAEVAISDNGEIYDGENLIGRIALLDVKNKDSLRKVGNSLYALREGINPETTIPSITSLKQGFIEGSNVDVVKEMTDMIAATRVFESTQKAIGAYDSMSEKLVNVVPKTTMG